MLLYLLYYGLCVHFSDFKHYNFGSLKGDGFLNSVSVVSHFLKNKE